MNEDHIAALDQSIGHDVNCWLATLPVPVPTSYGEYNLQFVRPWGRSLCCFGRKRKKLEEMKMQGIQGGKRGVYKFQPRHRLSFMNRQISDNYHNCGHGR
jgi:hypothetical protein